MVQPTNKRLVTEAALLAGYGPVGKTTNGLSYPFTAGHAGAGKLLYPDGSIETVRVADAQGSQVIDSGDFRLQADGSFVSIHSSVLSTISNVAGSAYNLSAAMAKQVILNPSLYYNNPPADILTLCTWEDMIREFGFRTMLFPEIKTDGTGPPTAGVSGAAFLAKVQAAGLTKSIIVNAFALAELTPLIAGGVECAINTSGDQSLGPALTAANAAWTAGVKHITIDALGQPSTAVVATLKAIGFRVWIYDVWTQYDNAAWLTAGADVVLSDDPVYGAGVAAKYRRTIDVFALGIFPAGFIPSSGAAIDRGSLAYGRWSPKFSSATACWGFLSPVANAASSYTVGFTVCFDTIGTDTTRHADVVVASSDDRYFDASVARAVNSGYICAVRPASLNQLQIYEVVAGVTTSKLNTGGPQPLVLTSSLASGTPITALPVVALTVGVASGAKYYLPTGQIVTLSSSASIGATSIAINSVTPSALVANSSTIWSELQIVPPLTLTAGLAAGAAVTTLSVSATTVPTPVGAKFALPSVSSTGAVQFAVASASAATGATSITVTSITPAQAVASGAKLPQGADITIAVSPTTLTITRTDLALSGVATSSAVRGGYIHAGQNNSSGASGMQVSYCKVSVT